MYLVAHDPIYSCSGSHSCSCTSISKVLASAPAHGFSLASAQSFCKEL